jgi:crotonobetainyl-CoA:carnitine CoA-transferase CaiB-like acyl-CoA transferase
VENAVGKFTYQEINEKFAAYSVKAARSKWRDGGLPVTTKMLTPAEVLKEEHWEARGTFRKISHPSFGVVTLPTTGKMTKTPLRVK